VNQDLRGQEPQLADPLESARQENEVTYEQLVAARREVQGLRNELESLRATKTFRYTASARHAYEALRMRLLKKRASPGGDRSYAAWIEAFDSWSDHDLDQLAQQAAKITAPPTFSVIVPTYDTPEVFLRAALESVLGQSYPSLELCVADDCSQKGHVRGILEEYAQRDQRVRLIFRSENGGIAEATNSALTLAGGEWVVFLDHDDVLPRHALARTAVEIDRHPSVQLIYTDEDHIDEDGQRFAPMFKTDFDPALLLSHNYICHLLALDRAAVSRAKGLRTGFEGSQDYDLVLRVAETLSEDQIRHIPEVLYHWRAHRGSTARSLSTKAYAVDSSRQAVTEHVHRTGRQGEVMSAGRLGYHRVRWSLPSPLPTVSIVIPTRDGKYLVPCLESVRRKTSYPRFEVIVVDNGSRHEDTLRYLSEVGREEPERVRVIRDDRPFNFSKLNNLAVSRTTTPITCLLNDDTEVMSADWLEELVGQVLQPGVGAVGAKLYYPDGSIQHAGIVLGMGGGAGHIFRGASGSDPGYGAWASVARSVSAVTAACMVVRKDAWESVGGLDEVEFEVGFNDVDLCLRIRGAGWRVVWSPEARLSHVDAATRGLDDDPGNMRRWLRELAAFRRRWGDCLASDPYFSPNLSLDTSDCSLAWPPRAGRLGPDRAKGLPTSRWHSPDRDS
jgi:GT2 family glycosyltransferase